MLLDKITSLSPFWAEVAETLSASDLTTTAGYYMYTPDDQPLIGPVPEVEGFHLNCGYWAGVMLSPEAGRRVAQLVTRQMRNADNPLRLARFAEGRIATGDSFLRGRH